MMERIEMPSRSTMRVAASTMCAFAIGCGGGSDTPTDGAPAVDQLHPDAAIDANSLSIGMPDPSFGTSGLVVSDTSNTAFVRGGAITSTGRILIAVERDAQDKGVIHALTGAGASDAGFGTGGALEIDLPLVGPGIVDVRAD